MKPSKIRVLIVEEDARLRRALTGFLSADPLMDIADCRRGDEARPQADADVAVLGLGEDDAVNRRSLGRLNAGGVRVIALAHTEADAQRYRALTHDVLLIPPEGGAHSASELFTRLKYQIRDARLARAVEHSGFGGTWRVLPGGEAKPRPTLEARETGLRLIAVGASAGGTQALLELIPALPPDMPAVALVQHMPESFVELFASHLREKSRMRVCLATGGERVERGTVYLTALDRHLTVALRCGEVYIDCKDGGDAGLRPSVDRLFSSAAALGRRAIGVILTGMGADGAKGLLEMRRAGAFTIGQDEGSCVVYGMPQAAYKLGAVARQLPLEQIAAALQRRAFPLEGSRNDGEA